MQTNFTLQPFDPEQALQLNITGQVVTDHQSLSIHYHISGVDFDKILWPQFPPSDAAARLLGLWQETCFEFFINPTRQPHYWEFNCAHTGAWNCFFFPSYRYTEANNSIYQGLKSLPSQFTLDTDHCTMTCQIDLSNLAQNLTRFDLAIAMVIVTTSANQDLSSITDEMTKTQTQYWALDHPLDKADFHHQRGFALRCFLDHANKT